MYQQGDKVVYGIHGVCEIVDIETKNISKKKMQYYVLEPTEQPGARFYVPTENAAAVSKLRPLISRQELDDLLTAQDRVGDAWISDENQRKQRYRELITSGDRAALMQMVILLYKHKQEQQESGKKFHLCDENFLRDAQRLLDSEFSEVLDIAQTEVADYIRSIIK